MLYRELRRTMRTSFWLSIGMAYAREKGRPKEAKFHQGIHRRNTLPVNRAHGVLLSLPARYQDLSGKSNRAKSGRVAPWPLDCGSA
jgi:hypothetical protein